MNYDETPLYFVLADSGCIDYCVRDVSINRILVFWARPFSALQDDLSIECPTDCISAAGVFSG
jgi:hypothetical protein